MSTFARNAFRRASARFSRKVIFAAAIFAVSAVGAFAAFGPQALSLRTLLSSLVGAAAPGGNVEISHATENERFEPTAMLTTSGTLATARSGHTATLLADGRVLVVGGSGDTSVEVFDPATSLAAATGNTNAARTGHTATRLADGRVLIAGGSDDASTEIYDPANGTFSVGPNMTASRTGHTATTLAGGSVLIAGGGSDSSEVFDGTAFSAGETMIAARTNASAVLMADGRVFIAGGTSSNTAEIYNPADGEFTAAGNAMTLERARALLRVLPDGKVQIIGGNGDGSMEVYDPAIDTIGAYAHVVPASDPCANLINYVLKAETRAALIFSGASAPERDRSGYTVTELGNGEALVIGGTSSGGAALNSVTVFQSSNATVTTDKLDYAPGETVTITGTGYGPDETVRVMIHEDPHTPNERGFDATATASGNFTGTYLVQDYDLNMKFVVGARGLTSGKTAQTTFTDNRTITGATVNGGSVTFVSPGEAITAAVTVQTTSSGGGGENWFSTSWRYATTPPGTTTCANTPDHNTVGTFTESFTTTAPAVAGTYNAYFNAWRTAGCANNASNTFVLTGGVVVVGTPTITSLVPSSKTYGDAGFNLVVNGTNFANGAIVRFNGSNRTTTWNSVNQVTAVITASDLLTAGIFPITVINPNASISNSVNFTVNQANQAINVTMPAPASAVYGSSFNVAATGGASGNPVVIAGSGACSGGGNSPQTITMTSRHGDMHGNIQPGGQRELQRGYTGFEQHERTKSVASGNGVEPHGNFRRSGTGDHAEL